MIFLSALLCLTLGLSAQEAQTDSTATPKKTNKFVHAMNNVGDAFVKFDKETTLDSLDQEDLPKLVTGGIFAGFAGALIGIPVLRLRGDYLAIVTLAFGQIIKSILMNAYIGMDSDGLHVSFVESKFKLQPGGKMLLNGPMGATGTQKIANFTVGIVLVLIALLIVYNLMFSRSGRAIMAARDNRIAAESVGIPISRTKMLAFVTSASLAGAAGALYGLNYSTLVPNKFDFNTSILILVYVVLGGLGNMTGTIISTVVLILLPELLRSLQDYRMLIYAVVLIVIMLVTNNEWLMTKWKSLFSGKAKGGA